MFKSNQNIRLTFYCRWPTFYIYSDVDDSTEDVRAVRCSAEECYRLRKTLARHSRDFHRIVSRQSNDEHDDLRRLL